jgi:dihydroorotase
MLIKHVDLFGEQVDILIEDRKIKDIQKEITASSQEVFDAKGLTALPGIVDLNILLQDDILNKKNIKSLIKTAKRSGVTTMLMRSSYESGDIDETLVELLSKSIDKKRGIDIHISSKALDNDDRLANITLLHKNGVKAFFTDADRKTHALAKVMQYSALLDVPIFIKPTDSSLEDGGVINDGDVSFDLGLPAISSVSEIVSTAKIKELAKYYGAKVVFSNHSLKEAVTLVGDSCRCCSQVPIHNLILDENSCRGFNTHAKLYPPLRSQEQKEQLIGILRSGMIHMLTSAHSPKSVLLKDRPFEDAAYGIDALEIYLPLCYTYLVQNGLIDLKMLATLISKNPAEILKAKDIGEIKIGYAADIVLFDTQTSYTYANPNSPYDGHQLHGKIAATILKGKLLD